jgi:hypothetical protein
MITFANDSTISHYHSSHHWIRLRILLSVLRQLQTAAHISLISCHRLRYLFPDAKIVLFYKKVWFFQNKKLLLQNR